MSGGDAIVSLGDLYCGNRKGVVTMIGFEVVASVVLFALLAVATAMAIVGLLAVGGALTLGRCPRCRHHLSIFTTRGHYCPSCTLRVNHPHLLYLRSHRPHLHPKR
jgi:hypothetical protein